MQQKRYRITEIWECEWWNLNKADASVSSNLREKNRSKRSVSEKRLRQRNIDGRHFGYVQCDIKVPQLLHRSFPILRPIFKILPDSLEKLVI